jgi:hypothetical protein
MGVARLIVVLVRIGLSIASSPGVILIPVLVPDLATTLSTSILSALCEPLIQIRPDDALIQLGTANVLHAVQRVLVRVVLNEAEAARCLLEAVEAHDQALDFAAFAEKLVYLLFGCVEGEVADVESSSVFELVFRFRRGFAVQLLIAGAASALLKGC